MTTAIDTTTTIAAPPDAVWAALTDWSLASRWMPGVTAMSGPVSPGAVVTFTVRGKDRTAVVDALDAPRTLALLSRSGPVTALYTYTLTGTAAGTDLRLLADVEVRGPLSLLAPRDPPLHRQGGRRPARAPARGRRARQPTSRLTARCRSARDVLGVRSRGERDAVHQREHLAEQPVRGPARRRPGRRAAPPPSARATTPSARAARRAAPARATAAAAPATGARG